MKRNDVFEKSKMYYNCFPNEEIEEKEIKNSDIVNESVSRRWIKLEFHESVLILNVVENRVLSINDSGRNLIYTIENKVRDRISLDILESNLDTNIILMIGAICQNLIAGRAEEDMAQRIFYTVIYHDRKYLKFFEEYFPKWVDMLNKFEKDKRIF